MPILVSSPARFRRSSSRASATTRRRSGDERGRVQPSLAGVRVVRSFALEQRESARASRTPTRGYLKASLGAGASARLDVPASSGVWRLARGAGLLLVRRLLLMRGPEAGSRRGGFFAFWLRLGRMTWPLISLGFCASRSCSAAAPRTAPERDLRRRARRDRRPAARPRQRAAGRSRVSGLSFRVRRADRCSTT